MDFLKQKYTHLKKKALQYINPNQNPTDYDKYAFNLLDKAQVDLFIDFMEKHPVNLHVVDFSKANLLIKATNIPTYNNPHTKLLTDEELETRAIKAIGYLLKRGADVNFQNSIGVTALLSACHWGYYKIAEFLLKNGANPNLGSECQGFCTNPLLSCSFKRHKDIIDLLISYGGDPAITQEYSKKTTGYKLTEEQLNYLYNGNMITKLVYLRHIERKKKKGVLGNVSEGVFTEICQNV